MDELKNSANEIGIELDPSQLSKFSKFLEELKAWNSHTNLTAIRDDSGIIKKHFLDSLSIIKAIPEETKTLIDVGSGAGFPGLPVAIAKPNISITLLEASEKKVAFLKHIVEILELKNVSIINGRAEDLGHDAKYREKFDIAAARAVATLQTLVEYLLPLVKIGGKILAQKNANSPEIENSAEAIKILGGTDIRVLDSTIDKLEAREIIVIHKSKPTPELYPRRSGIPSKKPL